MAKFEGGMLRSSRPCPGNADSKLSPIGQSELRRRRIVLERADRTKAQLLPWCISLSLLCIEVFLLHGVIGSFLMPTLIPRLYIAVFEYALLCYVSTMVMWMTYIILNPLMLGSKSVITEVKAPASPAVQNLLNKSAMENSFNMSHRSDSSWVDSHHFGSSPDRLGNSTRGSPNRSTHDNSMTGGGSGDRSFDAQITTSVYSRSGASPYSKPIDSIHTREQLSRLLRKNSDKSPHNMSSSLGSGSLSFFNILDVGSPERKPYQLSEQHKSPDGKENSEGVVQFRSNDRVYLSPVSADGEGDLDEMAQLKATLKQAKHNAKKAASPLVRRSDSTEKKRRSHSSPDRQNSSSGLAPIPSLETRGCTLEENELVRGEHRLRAWLVNTVLSPLSAQIIKLNNILEQEHANPPLRVGVTSVEALRAALSTRHSLRTTMLPYVLPYLSCHSNQAYLVSRIHELAADPFMLSYRWNAGGGEPNSDGKATSLGRIGRRPWGEHLPTDAVLVFSLFSAYMDSRLTSNPLVGSASLEQPFTAIYTLTAPQKPGAVHMATDTFYIHMTNVFPPNWELVWTDSNGSTQRIPIVKGPSNMFRAVVHFVHHAKVYNNGRIDVMNIGPTGLNIGCVLV